MDDGHRVPTAPVQDGTAHEPAALDLVRVLVVDDDRHLRALARAVLEGAGCRVATAPDGPTALSGAREHPPDVAVLDVRLPGMSGRDLAVALRDDPATEAVRIVIVTGSVDGPDLFSVWATNPHTVLRKPYDPTELVDAVHGAALAARRPPAPATGGRHKPA